jgi:HEPN domain-containing protein/predicted nucleotidyltransferase
MAACRKATVATIRSRLPRYDDAPVRRSLYASAMVHFAGTDSALDAIVQRLVPCVAPELILLFGSRAAGTARGDSDYDLMLVLREPAAAVERSRQAAYEALHGLGISVDVLACTVEQYERRQHDPGYLSWLIAREGRVLYITGAVPQRSSPPGDRVREEHEGEGLADWIRRAESDFKVAELSLATAEPSWDAICLHSHACVEKLLKALIVTQGVFPPRTHELPELLALQSPDIRDAAQLQATCILLMKVYPKSRYPEAGDPTPDEARSAIAAAREARRVLRAKLER